MPGYTIDQIRSEGQIFVLGYLLPVVAANTTITYGRIADLLQKDLNLNVRIFPTVIGGVVGSLMDRLHEIDENIPLINVLVVNQGTGSPGDGVDGYLRHWFDVAKDPLPSPVKAKLVAKAAREVYAYPHWARVYSNAFGGPVPKIDPTVLVTGTEQDGLPASPVAKRGGEAESTEHKALKAYVLAHPACINLKNKPDRAIQEMLLLSGDEVDVCFETKGRVDLVEVKSVRSDWNDLRRGVYQCVKYRAVFKAQRQGVTPDMQIVVTLVLETEPPPNIRDLAKLHEVKLQVVKIKRRKL